LVEHYIFILYFDQFVINYSSQDKAVVLLMLVLNTNHSINYHLFIFRFAELYHKYHTEVYPAKIVFVSFLHYQHQDGQMVRELKNKGFEPLQFKFHREQPDLTKLDKLFGLMSTETATFDQEINRLETKFKLEGITKMFEGITMNTVG
jgi:hypothetical protein